MNYYKISIINSPLDEFTYKNKKEIKIGTIVKIKIKNREVDGVVINNCLKPEFVTNDILNISEFYFSSKQIELAKFISAYYICSLGDAFGIMVPFHNTDPRVKPKDDENLFAKLEDEKELTLVSKKKKDLLVIPNLIGNLKTNIKLSKQQNEALCFLKQHKVSLLFGDTGSGKTEVYMKYFEEILISDKKSIFLMPEISLTPQMYTRLQKYFGNKVVMYHSKLTPKQKKETLEKIRNNEAKIIAGPRSTLFLPIKNLGLIVVDEEHDDSYKSSSRPKYNARDLAIYMGKILNIPVVLGSATPSLNSYIKFPYIRLKGSFFNSTKKFIYEQNSESLSPLILKLLKETLDKKEQSIIFIPTRANFKHLICNNCGYQFKCVFCSIGMSIHNKFNALKCHYCNYTQAIPQICPECASDSLISSRLGTAQALKEISEIFKDAIIDQFDKDTVTTTSKLKKILKKFNDKKTDILIGTQMLSKGHDYHNVTLVVILGMDNLLNMPHYASREKALSTFLQIAGRGGRKKNSKILVQSFNKDFFNAYLNDYELFLEEEKEYRKGLYPPFKKLCRVLFSHKNATKAKETMQIMHKKLLNFNNIEILGYGKCAVERISDKYRFEILLRSDKSTKLIEALKISKNNLCEIDMDPIEFA